MLLQQEQNLSVPVVGIWEVGIWEE